MSFPVVWLMPDVPRAHNDSRHRLTWAQAQVEGILTGLGGQHLVGFDELGDQPGAVVVVPAEYYAAREQVDWLNVQLNNLDWAVVFLTSDEHSQLSAGRLSHRLDRMRVWVQTPRTGHNDDRYLPFGPPPGTRSTLAGVSAPGGDRPLDWFFAGQVNHDQRRTLVATLLNMGGGKLLETPGFSRGYSKDQFLGFLAQAKVIPCPAGPGTPDSFRLWEALEAGCVPIADAHCPAYQNDYWRLVLDQTPPFPVVEDWSVLPGLVEGLLPSWPANANRLQSWWQQYQRDLVHRIATDITKVSGQPVNDEPPALGPGVRECLHRPQGGFSAQRQGYQGRGITVLIPTSPIPSHPDTAMIEETVASVRHHLPDADMLILADGVREDMEHRRDDYENYQRRLLWLAQHRFGRCTVIRFDEFAHQANMVRRALHVTRTPLVLFVEHDTPLVTDLGIDWAACAAPIVADELDVIRFHYEAVIPEPHWPMMIDKDAPAKINSCQVIRTHQFSARPHLASTDWYRQVIGEHFPETCRTFVEDKLHGVCANERWGRNRLAIYAPDVTNLKRSVNLDGRGDDPKGPTEFS